VDLASEFASLKAEAAWRRSDRNARTLVKEPSFRVVLVGMKTGARLREHRAARVRDARLPDENGLEVTAVDDPGGDRSVVAGRRPTGDVLLEATGDRVAAQLAGELLHPGAVIRPPLPGDRAPGLRERERGAAELTR